MWTQLFDYGPVRVLQAAQAPRGAVTLTVAQHAPGLTRTYLYGAVWQLQITTASSGRTVFLADYYSGFRGAWPIHLPADRYRVESGELVCHGDCNRLGALTDRRARNVTLDQRTLALVVDERAEHSCNTRQSD